MNKTIHALDRLITMMAVFALAFTLAGCEGDDGAPGADGTDGADGISCWDLNANGQADADEDLNGDGVVDAVDCNAIASGAYEAVQLHKGYFTDNAYEGTQSCLNCHGLEGMDMLARAHFTWQGLATNITGFETEFHGKNDIINNFCVAVPSNEGRCTQCHAGYGYDDKTFAFNDPETIDCLVCHDQTGTYKKAPKTAGLPEPDVDLNAVARSVADGKPGITNCIGCHANAGGGDNVKHGDLALSLVNATRDQDVHMGSGLTCIDCHGVKKDAEGDLIDHGIGGMPYHSVDEGNLQSCMDCHGDAFSIHVNSSVQDIVESHTTLACQVCHIPTFARETSTKTEWYWEDAGRDDITPTLDADGRPSWDKMKGSFVWTKNVRPTLKYYDGKWFKMLINKNDQYTSLPAVLAEPTADYTTPGAMIYPFKKMVGNQPADANNNTILVPHLFGAKGGPNAFWSKYDWGLALQDGTSYAGQTYTGAFEFVDTVMYLTVNHEIADGQQSLGYDGNCGDCHTGGKYDWTELGWTDDPILGGTRP